MIDLPHIKMENEIICGSALKDIFIILRAEQLNRFYPVNKERERAVNRVYALFNDREKYKSVMNKLRLRETKTAATDFLCSTPEDAAMILECARQLERPPLWIELPENSAFLLWCDFGYSGALKMAGLTPPSPRRLERAVAEYRLTHASLQFITEKQIDRIKSGDISNKDVLEILSAVCALAMRLGRDPTTDDISNELLRELKGIGKKWPKLLLYMGFNACAEEQHKKGVADFKNHTASWRDKQIGENRKARGMDV